MVSWQERKERMRPYDKLIEKYPLMFEECKNIDCGPGWYKIIEDLCSKIHDEIAAKPRDQVWDLRERMMKLDVYPVDYIDSWEEIDPRRGE